ncbi:MAG: polyphosphate kinase 1 [Ruminococcaceae bacterium]|nr:polyphosphate kinase 1 [Oscillospiraceae bacterium]
MEETERTLDTPAPADVPAAPPAAAEDALPAPEAAAAPTVIGPDCFVDRELSWLQFNLRVLREAGDSAVPLLERLKFLSIYQNNLDEFFMVRVGALIHRGIVLPDYTDQKTGWNTATQLRKIMREVARQQETERAVYTGLMQDMAAAGIEVVDFRRISKVDESIARKFFAEYRQLLTPRIVDAEHPMPFLDNREPFVAALLRKREKQSLGIVYLSRMPAYRVYEDEGKQKVLMTDALVRHFAPLLFKKHEVRSTCTIRVTRNADVFIDENMRAEDEDFRSSMEKLLKKRKRQQIVRLQILGKPERHLRELLDKHLKVPEKQVFLSSVPFQLSFGGALNAKEDMKFPERHSVRTVALRKGDYFRYLERNDLLLSFPFQSMTPFVELLYEAADDPEVVSIRITLYRLAASSKLAAALAYAADQGKDVLCLLELRARFDEKNNIDYSEMLEEAGCSVIYGLPEQKVHSKLCLITRKCGDAVKFITQIGTGNYNEVTSEQYCDLSLITSDEQIGRDAAAIFEALEQGQIPEPTEKLLTSPLAFKPRLLELLDGEIAKGSAGFVSIKVNSLNDIDVMRKLIDCSRAGVTVELFIRGICCLRPGLPGFSEHITVRSVVGRYLEHSRIYVFGRGEDAAVLIGSGDLLNRNTQRRVEAFTYVTTADTRRQVLEVMEALRRDDVKGWDMCADGSYAKSPAPRGQSSQAYLFDFFAQQRAEPLPPEKKKRRGLFRFLFG